MKDGIKIGYKTGVASDTITRPGDTTAYTAGDVISEVTTNDFYTFSLAGITDTLSILGSGTIESAMMMVDVNTTTNPDLELWLFDTLITEVADNGVFAPTDAEILTLIGVIKFPVASWLVGLSGADAAGNIVHQVNNVGIAFKTVGQNQNGKIFGQLVVRNAHDSVASTVFKCSLVVRLD